MNDTDALLLETWMRDRNAEAFKTLAKRYAGMVYGTCRRILNNPTEAEDAAQECFELLATAEKPVGDYLAPWLHRTACNKALTRLRSEHRRKEREARFVAESATGAPVGWSDIFGLVDEAVAELPEHLRAPVVAHFLGDQTHAAVALTLGIPRRTVTDRIEKGVELLRETLKGRGVAITGAALAGLIEANMVEAAPPALVANLGKIALSGAKGGTVMVAATTTAAGFWTAKTAMAGMGSVFALVLVLFVGYVATTRLHPAGSATPAPATVQQAANSTGAEREPAGGGASNTGVPAQAGGDAPPLLPAPEELGAISGRVYNQDTNRGIPFSTVRAKGPSGEVTIDTGLDGGYAIKGLAPGRYELSASAPLAFLNPCISGEKNAEVLPGETLRDLDFARTLGISVAGLVCDEAGLPVADAEVSIEFPPDAWSYCATSAKSQKDGTFKLTDVYPSREKVHVRAKNAGMAGVTQPLALGAEDLSGIKVVLSPGARVSGRLVDGAGVPIAGMLMQAWPKTTGGFFPQSVTDKEGHFEFFPLVADGYFLAASPEGSTTRANNTLDEIEVQPGRQMDGLELVYDLDSGVHIRGRVVDGAGAPAANELVRCHGAVPATCFTGADGRFGFSRLPEGYYSIEVKGQMVRKHFLPDGRDVQIVIGSPVTVPCRIVDAENGSPVTRFQIGEYSSAYWPNLETIMQMRHVQDAGGLYVLEMAPGDYRMCVRAPGYRVSATSLRVPAGVGAVAELVVPLERVGSLAVSVTDGEGLPVEGALIGLYHPILAKAEQDVRVERFAPAAGNVLGKTGADGRFETEWLAPDDGFVYIKHSDYAMTSAPLRFGAPITVCLERGGMVQVAMEAEGEKPSQYWAGLRYPDKPELGTIFQRADGHGAARFDHVRSGAVIARGMYSWEIPGDPDKRTVREEMIEKILVKESETTELLLRHVPGECVLTGFAHLDGLPFAEIGVMARITALDGSELEREIHLDAGGRFRLEHLPAGQAMVHVFACNYNQINVPETPVAVTLLPDQENRVAFNFTTKDLE